MSVFCAWNDRRWQEAEIKSNKLEIEFIFYQNMVKVWTQDPSLAQTCEKFTKLAPGCFFLNLGNINKVDAIVRFLTKQRFNLYGFRLQFTLIPLLNALDI